MMHNIWQKNMYSPNKCYCLNSENYPFMKKVLGPFENCPSHWALPEFNYTRLNIFYNKTFFEKLNFFLSTLRTSSKENFIIFDVFVKLKKILNLDAM